MVAPASAARYMLRMWILFSGVSRTQSTSGRCSLRQTSAARSINCVASPLAILASVPMLHGMTIMASVGYEPLATLAPISELFCCWIFFDFAPSTCATRLLRPLIPSSSAMTRKALSEAMKLMVCTRASRSSSRSSSRRKVAPLAPVVATVMFWSAAFFLFRIKPIKPSASPGTTSIGTAAQASQAAPPAVPDQVMGVTATLRLRRSAAQRHALAQVEREIRATDPHGRRKYLRDFTDAFQSYRSVLKAEQLQQMLTAADVVLVGDYHALPAAQRYAAGLLEELASCGRPLVLALEMVFVRDQHILDEWMCGQIDEQELRERIRFDADWGYAWLPYYELLEAGRRHARRICGLDCTPRNDLRKIVTRDRHAAAKLAEIREQHPDARIVVLIGESHLAPNHLPELLRQHRPADRVLTLLQNVDPLYWLAAGERERVDAVLVHDDVACVFSATPLEKYESYRQCLDRWRQERAAAPDFAPSIYNLVDALARFLNIERYSSHNGTQPRFLVDMLPEVYCREPGDIEAVLARKGAAAEEIKGVLARVEEGGSCFVPRLNAIFVSEWQLAHGAAQAARFLHWA